MGGNAWRDHVRAYAAEHNVAYRYALKDAAATWVKLVPAEKKKGTGKRGRPPLKKKVEEKATEDADDEEVEPEGSAVPVKATKAKAGKK